MIYRYMIFDMRVSKIPNLAQTKYWVEETCRRFGFGLEGMIHKEFKAPVEGPAFTLAGVLSSSHVVVHTTPEENWVEVAFACCKDVRLDDLADQIRWFWNPEVIHTTMFTGHAPGPVKKDEVK